MSEEKVITDDTSLLQDAYNVLKYDPVASGLTMMGGFGYHANKDLKPVQKILHPIKEGSRISRELSDAYKAKLASNSAGKAAAKLGGELAWKGISKPFEYAMHGLMTPFYARIGLSGLASAIEGMNYPRKQLVYENSFQQPEWDTVGEDIVKSEYDKSGLSEINRPMAEAFAEEVGEFGLIDAMFRCAPAFMKSTKLSNPQLSATIPRYVGKQAVERLIPTVAANSARSIPVALPSVSLPAVAAVAGLGSLYGIGSRIAEGMEDPSSMNKYIEAVDDTEGYANKSNEQDDIVEGSPEYYMKYYVD